jgi:hypothetical protein
LVRVQPFVTGEGRHDPSTDLEIGLLARGLGEAVTPAHGFQDATWPFAGFSRRIAETGFDRDHGNLPPP